MPDHEEKKDDVNAEEEHMREPHIFRRVLADSAALFIILVPHINVMEKLLYIAGDIWENEQKDIESRAARQEGPTSGVDLGSVPKRDLRLPLACGGIVESALIDETLRLMSYSDAWQIIPATHMTNEWQAK
eukprot:184224-Pyramimonas_sp.AAC.1